MGLTFVDYDHDGDLDLYITTAPDSAAPGTPPHNVVWRNNGNNTFTDVSAETGLGFAATGAGIVTTDFNNDRAIDFVIAGGQAGAAIYLNPREGEFRPLDAIDFNKEMLPPAVGVVVLAEIWHVGVAPPVLVHVTSTLAELPAPVVLLPTTE